jgi:chromate transporter
VELVAPEARKPSERPTLLTVLREWGRIGCLGFGGPPTHIAMLRELCVTRRGWLTATEFEDAIAACNLLPGPASTQLAIYCGFRVRGRSGALAGGLAFILPGMVAILALSALFLAGSPPRWVRAAGTGAGAAVAAVALQAGWSLVPPSWRRAATVNRFGRARWVLYLVGGAVAAATIGPWLVLVLLACGAVELVSFTVRRHGAAPAPTRPSAPPAENPPAMDPPEPRGTTGLPGGRIGGLSPAPLLAVAGGAAAATGGLLSLVWVAFKVGFLSYGGGFVIIPLMRSDTVTRYHWLTAGQFLNAVALGQVTPGPVVHTVTAVGYAAAGIGGGVLAATVAFAPSFLFVLVGGPHFDRLRGEPRVRAFLDGAGPAAAGAILGSTVPLAMGLGEAWEYAVLGCAVLLLLVARRGVVLTLLAAAVAGVGVVIAAGAPLPA